MFCNCAYCLSNFSIQSDSKIIYSTGLEYLKFILHEIKFYILYV